MIQLHVPGLEPFEPGWVWLAGAGPGHPGLLTLEVYAALGQADVVLYDALVSEAVLRLARPGTVLEFAGKRGGRPSCRQNDISNRLVDLARKGFRVLRLKGGDPLVFGRGGEEARALVRAGVPFRILPGLSAGIGGLAHAGIPLTDRQTNAAVTFVTAHGAADGSGHPVNWPALAQSGAALVVYMAFSKLSEVTAALIAGGRPTDEPAAIVAQATLPGQQVVETTLEHAAKDAAAAEAAGLKPPAMLVVGDIVRLRAALDWLGAKGGKKLDPDPLGLEPLSSLASAG